MYIEKGPSKGEKVMYWGLGLLMIAFFISVPFMWRDKQARLDKAWADMGCEMYDEEKATDIPAKCSNYFTDHYKAQEARKQPPDVPCIYFRDFPKQNIPSRCLSPEGDFRAE